MFGKLKLQRLWMEEILFLRLVYELYPIIWLLSFKLILSYCLMFDMDFGNFNHHVYDLSYFFHNLDCYFIVLHSQTVMFMIT